MIYFTRGAKVVLLVLGFSLAWCVLFIMLADFYEGLVEATVTAVQGGTYHPSYLRGENRLWWFVLMAISSISLAIGLRGEEKEQKTV